jgi:muconolactone delta-isomerase
MSGTRDFVGAVIAASLAAASPASAQTATPAGPPPGLPVVPITKVIAIGRVTDKWTPEAIRTVMPREVRETVALYLQGRLDQWFVRKDQPGVVFVFNSSDPREVHNLLEALPLGREKMMTFELIPLGPLAPLGLLLPPNSNAGKAAKP